MTRSEIETQDRELVVGEGEEAIASANGFGETSATVLPGTLVNREKRRRVMVMVNEAVEVVMLGGPASLSESPAILLAHSWKPLMGLTVKNSERPLAAYHPHPVVDMDPPRLFHEPYSDDLPYLTFCSCGLLADVDRRGRRGRCRGYCLHETLRRW